MKLFTGALNLKFLNIFHQNITSNTILYITMPWCHGITTKTQFSFLSLRIHL